MFGLKKKRDVPELGGPIEFETSVEIDRPASEVYPLVDVSSHAFNLKQMGNSVVPVGGEGDRFDCVLADMDDVTFHFRQLEALPPTKHGLECVIEPRVGNLERSEEFHTIEPLSQTRCRLTLLVRATFVEGLDECALAGEVVMMKMSVENDITKLAILAEDGLAAVKQYQEETF
jgi:hypothetical protein